MKTKDETTESCRELVKSALSKMLDLKGKGTWISVRDFSIGNLFKENGLGPKYATAAIEVLRKRGVCQFEGERSGMKFKSIYENYDLDFLTKFVLDLVEEKKQEYKESCKNNPIRATKKSLVDFDNKSEVKILRRVNIPQLGDLRYSIINNKITQVRIISASLVVNDKGVEKTVYRVEYTNPSYTDLFYLQDVSISSLFEDLDSLFQNLKKNVVLYVKSKK